MCSFLQVIDKETFHIHIMAVLKDYQNIMVNFTRKGYDGKDDSDDSSAQWSFAGAFLYSLTVITTIGKSGCSLCTFHEVLLID